MTWDWSNGGKEWKEEEEKGLGDKGDEKYTGIFHCFDLQRLHMDDLDSVTSSTEGRGEQQLLSLVHKPWEGDSKAGSRVPGAADACYPVGPTMWQQELGVPLQASCISVGP